MWINTAAATREGNQLSTCNPSGLQQRHLSSAPASQHQLHSTVCSQNEGTPCEGLLSPTSTKLHGSRGATIAKFIPGGSYLAVDISGGVIYSNGKEEDCELYRRHLREGAHYIRGHPWRRQLLATATRRNTTVPTTSSREAPILSNASLVASTIARNEE